MRWQLIQTDKPLYLITSAGLSIVQLGESPLSIGHVTPSAGPAGTTVTIHGSGFEPTTTPSANGSPTTVTFVDPDSLKIIMPGVASCPVQVTVSNQSGQAYSLDSAFVVQ